MSISVRVPIGVPCFAGWQLPWFASVSSTLVMYIGLNIFWGAVIEYCPFVSTCMISTSSCRFKISEKMCLVSVSTFYFLLYKIIFLTFFIHRFCSVFLSVFWIVIGLPFTHLVLLSRLVSNFLSCIYQKYWATLSFSLPFFLRLSPPFCIFINCVFITCTVYRRFVYENL